MNIVRCIRLKLINILSHECCANCSNRNRDIGRKNYAATHSCISGYLCKMNATDKWPHEMLYEELDRCDHWTSENINIHY